MASVLKKYHAADASPKTNNTSAPITSTPAPQANAEKKPTEKKEDKLKKSLKNESTIKLAEQESEVIAQTGSDELMTNSADKQEVDNDTNEASNLEKQIEAQAKAIEEKQMKEQKEAIKSGKLKISSAAARLNESMMGNDKNDDESKKDLTVPLNISSD